MKNRIYQKSILLNTAKAADGFIHICDVDMGAFRSVLLNPSLPSPNTQAVGPVGAGNDGALEVVARMVSGGASGILPASFPAFIVLRCAYGFSGNDPSVQPFLPMTDQSLPYIANAGKPDLYEAEHAVLRGQAAAAGSGGAMRYRFTPGGRVARLGFLVSTPGATDLSQMSLDVEVWAVQ